MDSIEDILIILFIIISIASSFFRKKKQKGKPGSQIKPIPQIKSVPKVDPFEMLTPLRKEYSEVDEYFKSLEIKKPQKSEAVKTQSEVYEEKRKYEAEISKLKHQAFKPSISEKKKSLQPAASMSKTVNKRALKIKQNFSEPKTIQEYFIINELLNKPLALRD